MKNLNHIKECLLQIEKKIEYNGSIRDDITGPIIDLFFTKDTELVKNLSNDLKVYYLYRTKIARDIYFNDDKKVDYLWEPQTTKIIKYLGLRSTSDALIAGAYFGDSSLILAKINPKNKVHCFEPNKSQRKQLIAVTRCLIPSSSILHSSAARILGIRSKGISRSSACF